jgi:hypothetical protein
MSKYYVSDVMLRKQNDVEVGYIVVITYEDDRRQSVSDTAFIPIKELPVASKATIKNYMESWLDIDNRSTSLAEKASIVVDEQVKSLIPEIELSLKDVKK